MARSTTGTRRPGEAPRGRALLLLMVVFMVGCVHAAGPATADETGIRGTVSWGPVRPGPARLGESDVAPLQASFDVYGAAGPVARFESDEEGRFELPLPPGDYTLVPSADTPIPLPQRQKTAVTVPDSGFVTVEIRLDTGMR